MTTLPVIVDAMGGDNAPADIVAGAISAASDGHRVELIGRPEDLTDTGALVIHSASEVIDMGDEPGRAVRTMKDSSIVRAAERVRDGHASAMVSAGNTGAVAAAALLRMKRLRGVNRPAIATTLPIPGATPKILLDSGAMADCQPEWLQQYARMGAAFGRIRYGLDRPTVGLMSIGEEPEKGNQLTKDTHKLLAADSTIEFVGNVEGRDVLGDACDVIVTDGFTGNVVLKTLEGTMSFLVGKIIEIMSGPGAEEVGGAALGLLAPIAAEMHPDAVGGAMLLGVNGVCIISHGSSSPTAIHNAIGVATEMVERDLVGELSRAIGEAAPSGG